MSTPRQSLADLSFNDGSRPNLLELGRVASGELDGDLAPAYAAALDEARRSVAPFDYSALVERSRTSERAPGGTIVRGPWQRWSGPAVGLLMAAMALFFLRPPDDLPGVRTKSDGAAIGMYVLRDGVPREGRNGDLLAEGDRVQFTYLANGNDTLVLLSIDGAGKLSVFWPETGDEPETVQPDGPRVLAGSVRLDGTPGPEAFVALFGFDDVDSARRLARETWLRGGVPALRTLARQDPDIDLIVIEKE